MKVRVVAVLDAQRIEERGKKSKVEEAREVGKP